MSLAEYETDAAVIAANAQAAVELKEVDLSKEYVAVIPEGGHLQELDLDRLRPNPRRAEGIVQMQTVGAFQRFVERHDRPEETTLWVDGEEKEVIAVVDDHTNATPGWRRHRAILQLKTTPAWDHWLGRDGRLMSQEDFAEHIEDGLADIVEPDGATMLEIAQSIQGTANANFKSAKRLANGQIGVEYTEEVRATAGTHGDLEIPERFNLGIAPFVGEDAYEVQARLRYRVRNGDLVLGYRLDRPGDVLEDAVGGIADRLGQRFGLERVFVGRPR